MLGNLAFFIPIETPRLENNWGALRIRFYPVFVAILLDEFGCFSLVH